MRKNSYADQWLTDNGYASKIEYETVEGIYDGILTYTYIEGDALWYYVDDYGHGQGFQSIYVKAGSYAEQYLGNCRGNDFSNQIKYY